MREKVARSCEINERLKEGEVDGHEMSGYDV